MVRFGGKAQCGHMNETNGKANKLMYLGGSIALAAVSVLLGKGWHDYGPTVGAFGVLLLATALFLGAHVLLRRGWRIPAGLAATVGVALVPLIVFATGQVLNKPVNAPFGEYEDFYTWISSQWVWMEFATIGATLLALRWFRLPILMLPATVCSWFFAMDGAGFIFGADATENERLSVFAVVGSVMLAVGFALDHRRHRHHATWMHLGGLITIGGVSCFTGEAVWWVLAAIGVVALIVGVLTQRTIYFVFGGLWSFSVASHLAYNTFGGEVTFPLFLLAVGGGLVAWGMRISKKRTDASSASELSAHI
jgi:hypothetical protein